MASARSRRRDKQLEGLVKENTKLEGDVKELEAAYNLHRQNVEQDNNSVYGLIRAETGGPRWQHGGTGKLTTYKSNKDLIDGAVNNDTGNNSTYKFNRDVIDRDGNNTNGNNSTYKSNKVRDGYDDTGNLIVESANMNRGQNKALTTAGYSAIELANMHKDRDNTLKMADNSRVEHEGRFKVDDKPRNTAIQNNRDRIQTMQRTDRSIIEHEDRLQIVDEHTNAAEQDHKDEFVNSDKMLDLKSKVLKKASSKIIRRDTWAGPTDLIKKNESKSQYKDHEKQNKYEQKSSVKNRHKESTSVKVLHERMIPNGKPMPKKSDKLNETAKNNKVGLEGISVRRSRLDIYENSKVSKDLPENKASSNTINNNKPTASNEATEPSINSLVLENNMRKRESHENNSIEIACENHLSSIYNNEANNKLKDETKYGVEEIKLSLKPSDNADDNMNNVKSDVHNLSNLEDNSDTIVRRELRTFQTEVSDPTEIFIDTDTGQIRVKPGDEHSLSTISDTGGTRVLIQQGTVNKSVEGQRLPSSVVEQDQAWSLQNEIRDIFGLGELNTEHGTENKSEDGNIAAFQQKPRNCSFKQAAVTRFSLKSDDILQCSIVDQDQAGSVQNEIRDIFGLGELNTEHGDHVKPHATSVSPFALVKDCNSEVQFWLRGLGLPDVDKYVKIFADHEIDLLDLEFMTAAQLHDMGVTALGALDKILKGVKDLRSGGKTKISQTEQRVIHRKQLPLSSIAWEEECESRSKESARKSCHSDLKRKSVKKLVNKDIIANKSKEIETARKTPVDQERSSSAMSVHSDGAESISSSRSKVSNTTPSFSAGTKSSNAKCIDKRPPASKPNGQSKSKQQKTPGKVKKSDSNVSEKAGFKLSQMEGKPTKSVLLRQRSSSVSRDYNLRQRVRKQEEEKEVKGQNLRYRSRSAEAVKRKALEGVQTAAKRFEEKIQRDRENKQIYNLGDERVKAKRDEMAARHLQREKHKELQVDQSSDTEDDLQPSADSVQSVLGGQSMNGLSMTSGQGVQDASLESLVTVNILSPSETVGHMSTTTSKPASTKKSMPDQLKSPIPKKKTKITTPDTTTAVKAAKAEEKEKREAALESSKLMAARLLQNKANDQTLTTQIPAQKPQTVTSPAVAPLTQVTQQQNTEQTPAFTFATGQAPEPQVQHNYLSAYNAANNYDWNYNFGNNYQNYSASEYFAHSLTSNPEHATAPPPTNDCSKCLPLIYALEQRVKYLEERFESHMTPHQSTPTHTKQSTSSHINAQKTYSEGLSPCLETPTTCNETVTQPVSSKESTKSSSEVDLVNGYEARISVQQLDVCLRKSRGSSTALARLLCSVFFTDDILARSSARGIKDKPALDEKIVNAIISPSKQQVTGIAGSLSDSGLVPNKTDVKKSLRRVEPAKRTGSRLQAKGDNLQLNSAKISPVKTKISTRDTDKSPRSQSEPESGYKTDGSTSYSQIEDRVLDIQNKIKRLKARAGSGDDLTGTLVQDLQTQLYQFQQILGTRTQGTQSQVDVPGTSQGSETAGKQTNRGLRRSASFDVPKSSPIESVLAEDETMNKDVGVRDDIVVRMSKRELLDEMRKEKKNHHLQIR